ncbi:MAG TPA: hypothetical protein VHY84_18090 [Bryobacteraceae bacterium]|jgi:hypothetical protein|nr:hypothetical protein [Bryobacteraceae bacterium]
MSLVKEVVDVVRQLNAQKSTGPKTPQGRQRAKFNALKHNLSGQHLILQETELAAYNRMSDNMLKDLKPKSEPERQIALKIIDTNFRLNRMAAIESNMFSFGIVANEHGASDNEDRIEVMGAQTRAWTQHGPLIDVMGRYEARLSRQLLKYQQEFERLQAVRKRQEHIDKFRSDEEIEADKFDPASFLQNSKDPNAWRLLSYLKPPPGWKKTLPKTENGDSPTEKEAEVLEKQAA